MPSVELCLELLSASLFVLSVGLFYAMPLYLPSLKIILDFDQRGINALGSTIYACVGLVGIPSVPPLMSILGYFPTMLLGSFVSPLGYVLIWMATQGYPGWLVFPGGAAIGSSCGLFYALLSARLMGLVGASHTPTLNGYLATVFVFGGLVGVGAFELGFTDASEMLASIAVCQVAMNVMAVSVVIITRRLAGQSVSYTTINAADDDAKGTPHKSTVCENLRYAAMVFIDIATSPAGLLCLLIEATKTGIGPTVITNLGNLVAAMDEKPSDDDVSSISWAVAVVSVGQAIGRAAITVACAVAQKYRPDYNPTLDIATVLGCIYAAILPVMATTATRDNLVWLVFIFGIAYGGMWAITSNFVMLTPRNSMSDFSITFSVLLPLGGLGAFALNEAVAVLYARHTPPHSEECLTGRECYASGFLVLTGAAGAFLLFVQLLRCFPPPSQP